MLKYIRNTKAFGTTGTISIKTGTNDPSNNLFEIANIRTEDGGKTWFGEIIGTFCTTCAVIVKLWKDIVWGNGLTTKPKSYWE